MKTLLLLALVISGCVKGEIDEPQACDTRSIMFPGVLVAPGFLIPPVTQSFTIPTGVGTDWISNIMLISGDLSMTDGSTFGFLDELMISVAGLNGGDSLILWDIQAPNTNVSTLPIKATDKNIANYISKGNDITMEVTISTQAPPTDAWSVDVDLCLSAHVSKTYSL